MRRDGFALVLLVLVWLAGGGAGAPPLVAQTATPTLSVAFRGEPAQPGSVLAITVTTSSDVESVSANAFGQMATLIQDGSNRRWRGLIGVDVAATEPSRVDITARPGNGLAVRSSSPLAWKPRDFATRRLTVASRFVDPSPGELERIRLESARLEALFEIVTVPDRFPTFVPPLPGVRGRNFGSRSIFNGEPRAPHAGADFRGATGTPIAAPAAGRVVLAEPLFFTGHTVVIDHGLGLYSLLAHLSRLDVQAGDAVEGGAVVGLLGATGRATGPHLHWTVRLGMARVDPMRVLELLAPAHSGATAPRPPTTPGA